MSHTTTYKKRKKLRNLRHKRQSDRFMQDLIDNPPKIKSFGWDDLKKTKRIEIDNENQWTVINELQKKE